MFTRKTKTKDKPYNASSLNRIILMMVTGAILIQGVIWLMDSIYLFNSKIEDVKQIQTEYIKAELKERVASVIDYSDYRSQETEVFLRESLASRTNEAYVLMQCIYDNNKDIRSKEEITSMIKDALREIRFNEGRGYYFIDTLEGDVILYPVYPESEGQNLIDLKDDHGNYVMQDEIELVKAWGQGYIEGYWKNPNANDDKTYKKITFVRAFEPYGWYLGCGDYIDEIEKDIQEEILAYVDSIQYGENNEQYVFLHDYNGVELANGVYPELVGNNYYDLEDIKGSKVYQEQIKLCIESGGGFLTHYWPKAHEEGYYKKLTYVAPLPKWNWVIGTGVDVSNLDQMIKNREKELQGFIWERILIILTVLVLLVVVSMFYVKGLMAKIKKNFQVFRDSMISAKMKLVKIDVDSLDYADFSELAEVTNSMTERINQLLHFDVLTGVFNRRYIMETFDNVLKKSPDETGIIVFDIDYFKKVNDQFGHEVGDQTLLIIASTIKNNLPESAFVGRFGGEEFIGVLPSTSIQDTIDVAEKIRMSVETLYIEAIHGSVTISGGVAHSSQWEKEDLFKQADHKLYQAKELGRNRIEY